MQVLPTPRLYKVKLTYSEHRHLDIRLLIHFLTRLIVLMIQTRISRKQTFRIIQATKGAEAAHDSAVVEGVWDNVDWCDSGCAPQHQKTGFPGPHGLSFGQINQIGDVSVDATFNNEPDVPSLGVDPRILHRDKEVQAGLAAQDFSLQSSRMLASWRVSPLKVPSGQLVYSNGSKKHSGGLANLSPSTQTGKYDILQARIHLIETRIFARQVHVLQLRQHIPESSPQVTESRS